MVCQEIVFENFKNAFGTINWLRLVMCIRKNLCKFFNALSFVIWDGEVIVRILENRRFPDFETHFLNPV